ncbi:erythromycin esterase family protein [Nonomuraea fastidiosa]|jgi:erythromycin esterase-like protein|uniref:erythromycin esterase family protein n=1 Tax=Nonomuraea TaxID=83681 RepID=UPI00343003F8
MDIKDTAHPLDGAALSAFLDSLPSRPRLLGLGEATHRVKELRALRNELFPHLVEHEGYRAIALEIDCLKARIVDDYVTTGKGSLDEVMEHGFSHGFGAMSGNRDLVQWMRAYNEEHDAKLRFFGFDGPLEYWARSPREALTGLYDLLHEPLPCTRETLDSLLGADERWEDEESAMNPARSIGRSPEAVELRIIADDLAACLDMQAPQLSAEEREQAELYARTATGLLRYHYWLADDSPARWGRLSALRDAMMAANLVAIAERHGPALLFSHNLHLQRNEAHMRFGDEVLRWSSAGAIAGTRLGDGYAFLASALGTVSGDAPAPGTVEGLMAALPWDRCLLDGAELAAAVSGLSPRVSSDFAYFPLDPAHIAVTDGVYFVREATDET